MSIRNRLLLLLLLIALTPLVASSLLQQASIWVMRNHLAVNTREVLEANARQDLQERLQSDVEILERDRRLADAQLRRQVREVEQRLAGLTPPAGHEPGIRSPEGPPMMDRPFDPNDRQAGPRGRGGLRGGFRDDPGGRGPMPDYGMPAAEFALVNAEFGLDPNLTVSAYAQHSYFNTATPAVSGPAPAAASTPSTNTAVSASDPNASGLTVNYQSQSCLVARGDDEAFARQAMEKLASLTSVCRDVCTQGPAGILWLHTSLDAGLHLTYPGGALPRELTSYNPTFTAWYRQAREASENQRRPQAARVGRAPTGDVNSPFPRGFRRGGGWARMLRERQKGIDAMQGVLTHDPFTGQWVVIRSMPITYANGRFAGAAAMVRTVPEIFSSLQLPERWGTDIERMLILVDPNAVNARDKVRVLLEEAGRSREMTEERTGPPEPEAPFAGPPPRENFGRGGPGFGRDFPGRGEARSRSLAEDLNDVTALSSLLGDVAKDQGGVRQVEYRGRQCLLAYQPLDIPQAAAVLVVPYDRIVDFASTVEQSLVKESVRWLQVMTLVLLLVGIAAVSLAALKARNLTQPINALIDAGRRLGNGDYNAHVDIRTSDELEHLGRVFNEAGPKLRDHERMKRSLDLASAIQHSLLPGHTPQMENFELAGRCVYCDETGGDYYDFIPVCRDGAEHSPEALAGTLRTDRIGLALGDVSGHGIGAALLMAVTRGLLHAEAPHTQDDLAGLMTRLNRELVHDTAEETFVTLFYGILDDRQRSLIWASAGHEPTTWYHAATGQIDELPNTGMLLGVLPEAQYRQAGPVPLAPGDILVIGTDGIWEAHDDAGRLFGKNRLHQIVKDAAALSAPEICDRIIDTVALFVHPAPHSDDITLIVVKAK